MTTAAVYQSRAARTEATIMERAHEVFAGYRSWRFAHRRADGHPFFMMDGTRARGAEAAPVYYVDLHDCTCPSHRDGRVACKHMRAARLWFEAVKRGEIRVPRRMTAGDTAALDADLASAVSLDVAESADALLDAYHAQRAELRAARFAEPPRDWWLAGNGGVVWLQAGDRIGSDTEELRTVGGVGPAPVPCEQAGCHDPCAPDEPWCTRHMLCDAF